MLITYYTHKPEESKTRRVSIGQKLAGIRLLSAALESGEELDNLLSEKGIEWAKRNMRFKVPFGHAGVKQEGDVYDPWFGNA